MASSFLSKVKKTLGDETRFGASDTSIHTLPTGINVLDYLCGCYDVNGNIHLGLSNGRVLMFLGKSQSGKSTAAYQAAYGMTAPYENGNVVIYDYEQALTKDRVISVANVSSEEFDTKWSIKSLDIYTETLRDAILTMYELKKELKDEIQIINPRTGKKEYPPTVFISDSVGGMRPKPAGKKKDGTEKDNNIDPTNMDSARAAKANYALLRTIMQPCAATNITVIFINHLQPQISTNGMPVSPDFIYLGNKTVPGGGSFKYLPTQVLLFHPGEKLVADKTLKIQGMRTKATVIKSRTGLPNKSVDIILDQSNGFDDVVSTFEFLRTSQGKIKGAGTSYYLEGLPTIKFTLSGFKEKYNTIPELKAAFDKIAEAELKTLLTKSRSVADTTALDEDPNAMAAAEAEFDATLNATLAEFSSDEVPEAPEEAEEN